MYLVTPFGAFSMFQYPFWLSVIYMLFGAEFFLFRWVDDMLIFLIKHFVSNLNFFFVIWQPILLFWSWHSLAGSYFSEFHISAFVFSLLSTGYFWNRTMRVSPGAIRYVDPSWDEIAEGERLWPSILYFLGVVDKNGGDNNLEKQEVQEENSEVSDQVWTL